MKSIAILALLTIVVVSVAAQTVENWAGKEIINRLNKIKKFVRPVAEEELAWGEYGRQFNFEKGQCIEVLHDMNSGSVFRIAADPSSPECKLIFKINHVAQEEEAAFNLKKFIKDKVIGLEEEEENMSLKEMFKRYNKVKKFIPPVAEEEALLQSGDFKLSGSLCTQMTYVRGVWHQTVVDLSNCKHLPAYKNLRN